MNMNWSISSKCILVQACHVWILQVSLTKWEPVESIDFLSGLVEPESFREL